MKKYNKKGFTLIELLIVMSIMGIISVTMYAPFQHYQTKQKVRNSANIITQALYSARNNAIYGASTSSGNLDIGIYFEKGEEEIKVFGYPFDNSNPPVNFTDDKFILEKIELEPGVQITSDTGLFLYKAISGSGIYKDVENNNNNKTEITVGFNGATEGLMLKKIEYYTKTYISDVK